MKMTLKTLLAVMIVIVFTISDGLADELSPSGFLGGPDVYKKLEPGPEGGAKLRWLKPGVDFKTYNKFMVDSVIFYLADDAENKGIDPQEMKELADKFNYELVSALNEKYPIVGEPGPDVARIRIAITNIKPSKPGSSAVTSVLPVGLAVSLVKKGSTGGWTGSGETAVEMMALDTMTNEVIALAMDQQRAAFSERFSQWASAEQAFKFWSGRLAAFMDNIKGVTEESKK